MTLAFIDAIPLPLCHSINTLEKSVCRYEAAELLLSLAMAISTASSPINGPMDAIIHLLLLAIGCGFKWPKGDCTFKLRSASIMTTPTPCYGHRPAIPSSSTVTSGLTDTPSSATVTVTPTVPTP